ncbi:alpha/beta fold hydrolase [Microbacterium esteraromaticum]|uniref:alpha/beta fold hydrolase n=1 Tax=Microbacterium esteraromaticum TaxID=57043 RepID=UPI001C96AA38|nr:alpha/beta hydrolase [Microbacterium esteraromaticum]MBY6061702.1 alpha/beta hydrolase [Microbacterium esteraromaticum]
MDTTTAQQESLRDAWNPPLPDAPGFVHTVIRTSGLRTHVATIGAGEPVVLLHGFPQHWWEWRSVAPAVAAAGYRAICPDLRGSGWTEADDPRFAPEIQADDVHALLDTLGIDRAHFLCHDMGAIAGMQLAYRHPERVRSLVQLAVPPGFMEFSPATAPAFAHMPALVMHRPGRSLQYLFGERYAAQPMSDETVEAYLRPQRRPEIAAAVRSVYRGMVLPVAFRLLGGTYKRMRLHPPTRVVFGAADGPFAEPTARRICRNHAKHADRFDLVFVDQAAHFIVDDAPEAVARIALEWFARAEEGQPDHPVEE